MMTSRGSLKVLGPQASSPVKTQPSPPSRLDQRRAEDHDAIGQLADRWCLAAVPDLPLRLPRKGSAIPARTAGVLNALLRRIAVPDLLRAAGRTWLGSDEHGSRTTQASHTRAMSWRLWSVQRRGLPLADIPQQEALSYAAGTYAAGLSAASCRLRIEVVTSWYSFLHACGLTTRNPFTSIQHPPGSRAATGRYPPAEHLHDLLAWASVHESRRQQAWLGLLIGTACNVSPARTCSLHDLTRGGTHHRLRRPAPDGRHRQRVYDLGPHVSSLLSACLQPGRTLGPLFVAAHGTLLRPSYTGELLWRLARQAVIPLDGPASPAVMRHSVAAALIRASKPSAVMRALHGCAAGDDIDRALVCNAALQRWDTHLAAGVAQRQKRYRR
ncbi:hypothetical protein [Nonomuraea sp. NPDC049158]|uniref:hypothetical protein n=1 Tax=Nonomuraea sp. NPDC049158 TaxID=3155649 RepID=UPI0033E4AE8D